MKGYSFQWKMAGRRKDACLLVLLFAAVVTAFMLIYPQLINSTREELENAYDKTEVKGWMMNADDFDDPVISEAEIKTLVDGGFFSSYSTSVLMDNCRIARKSQLEEKVGEDADAEALEWAFKQYVANDRPDIMDVKAFNNMEASDALMRAERNGDIRWLDGYSGECLATGERICLIRSNLGYEPGDIVPMMLGYGNSSEGPVGLLSLKVVGVYSDGPVESAIIPLNTYKEVTVVAQKVYRSIGVNNVWKYSLNEFIFTVADNRRIPELKDFLDELDYGAVAEGEKRTNPHRISLDDRILEGAVSPIKSNLSLLEGLYLFFFAVIAFIGFFLSFLLARGRKPEYAVMRLLGESGLQITVKALLEQSILCFLGMILGTVAVQLTGLGSFDPMICGAILLLYTLGAALAVMMTVRVNVMEILRDKE